MAIIVLTHRIKLIKLYQSNIDVHNSNVHFYISATLSYATAAGADEMPHLCTSVSHIDLCYHRLYLYV